LQQLSPSWWEQLSTSDVSIKKAKVVPSLDVCWEKYGYMATAWQVWVIRSVTRLYVSRTYTVNQVA